MMDGRSKGWSRSATAAVVASALTLLVTGGIVAAQDEGSEQIHACAGDRGLMRMVPSASECTAGETPVAWNIEGRQGVAGPAGKRGAKGKPGKAKIKIGGDAATQVLFKQVKKQLGAVQDDVTKIKKTVLFNKGYMTAAKLGRMKVTSVNAYAACNNARRANYHIRLHHYDEDLADDPLATTCFFPGPP